MLLKKDDPHRIRISVRKHFLMVLRSFGVTSVALGLWYFANQMLGIHFGYESKDSIDSVEVMLVVPFAIVAAEVLRKAYSKQSQIVEALFNRDRHVFLQLRDERTPVSLHVIMISLASGIILLATMMPFSIAWHGGLYVGVVTLTYNLIWEAVRLLEDPTESQWISSRVPRDWMTVDIDQEFFRVISDSVTDDEEQDWQ